jgi:aromatic-L-amino-acid decarboxylase
MSKLTIFTTTQTHSLGMKAALVLGLKVKALEVEASDEYGLRGEALRRSLEEEGNGEGVFAISSSVFSLISSPRKCFVYVCVVATIGTTSSGAIDNLHEIGQVRSYVHFCSLHALLKHRTIEK